MIVQPDFLEHWKTRLLVSITGDESSPLCVLRLWAHCQSNKRSEFPGMTAGQLDSITRWNDRKPAAHVALVKAGFVDKLKPKGFAAHEWSEHNRQLTQKWEAGKNGGRPQKAENTNELPSNEKPTDNRPITGRELDRLDQTRPDQTRPDQTRLEKTSPDQTNLDAPSSSVPSDEDVPPEGTDSFLFSGGESDGLGGELPKRALPFTPPNLEQVENCLRLHFAGAERYAKAFLKAMAKQAWRDRSAKPIHDWRAAAKSYASACALNQGRAKKGPNI